MRILILALLPLPLMACQSNWERGERAQANGSGAQAEGGAAPGGTASARSYDATGFTGVDVRGPDDVTVRVADAFSVRAEGDSRVLDRLEVAVVDGTLRIGRKNQNGWSWSSDDNGVRIHVTLPRLTRASISGSGDLDADRAEGDFAGSVAGSGNLRIAALTGGAADLSIAGSGDLSVAGTATRVSASVAGSGDIDAAGLTATSANVSIAGSGNVRGTVKGDAAVSIIGSGDVELGGGARCTVSTMGSGEARCS